MTNRYRYEGSELELFAQASNWKRYLRSKVDPFIGGEVLEVGAGIGSTTRFLLEAPHHTWTCLEPDEQLAKLCEVNLRALSPRGRIEVLTGSIADLPLCRQFDSIVYVDVLEHIRDDKTELLKASQLLRNHGTLIVIVPAHQILFSAFDAAIGHYRRYNKKSLRLIAPSCMTEELLIYLDSVGLLGSIFNRLFAGRSLPTSRQVIIWDRILVGLSRLADRLLRFKVGRSILAAWRKTA